MAIDTFVDYYAILGVAETADDEAIKQAILKGRRVWIKRQSLPDPKRRQEAEDRVRNIDEAEKVLLNARKREKHDSDRMTARPSPPPPSEGDGNWLDRAQQYLDAGNPYSAHYASREAITLNGSEHRAWSIRAHSSFLMGNWRDSEYEFNEAIRLKPDEADYHFELGSVYEAAGQWKDALGKYEEALRIQPGNPVFKTSVASVYLQNDMAGRALPLMEEVVKQHANVGAFQYYLAWALVDSYDSYATVLKNGSFSLTSPEQIERMRRDMTRAKKLKFEDASLRRYIEGRLNSVAAASTEGWMHSERRGLYIAALLVCFGMLLWGSGGARVMGLLLGGVIGFVYYQRHHMPTWEMNAKRLKGSSQVAKWGIGQAP